MDKIYNVVLILFTILFLLFVNALYFWFISFIVSLLFEDVSIISFSQAFWITTLGSLGLFIFIPKSWREESYDEDEDDGVFDL